MNALAASSKPLMVNPLRVGRRVGATLAFLGLSRAIALEHGVRGCASFTKLFYMRHFHEPIPMQTTAVDHLGTVMGAEANVAEAVRTIIRRTHPEIIGVFASAPSDFQGVDLTHALAEFRGDAPTNQGVSVFPVPLDDGEDCLEAGFARALEAILDALVPAGRNIPRDERRVNVLIPSMLTPADAEALKDWIAAFGLTPVLVPDLGDSLDGHLQDQGFTPLTYGGTSRQIIGRMSQAAATIVIGDSLNRAADRLKERTGIPDFRFPTLMGLDACDDLTEALRTLSGQPVPARLERERARLLDAMVDCQFHTAGARIALAADPDLAASLSAFAADMGLTVAALVASAPSPALAKLPEGTAIVGDLDDFERLAKAQGAHLLLGNSHVARLARALGRPAVRVGYPQYDRMGALEKTWIGYGGARRALFELVNALLDGQAGPRPYFSTFRTKEDA